MTDGNNDIDTLELDRVMGAPAGGVNDAYECFIDTVLVICNGDAAHVLERSREAYAAFLRGHPKNWPDHQASSWPSVMRWKELLPTWFVANVGTDAELQAWLDVCKTSRPWFWWAATVRSPSLLELKVAVWDTPYTDWTLRTLLESAGARRVETLAAV